MNIGLPKEIKDGERRVALLPAAVQALVNAGHRVNVQCGAGAGAGWPDDLYAVAGANLVASAAEAFDADLVVKVKEIQSSPENEWQHLHPGSMLFSFLHLASDPFMAHELLARRITGIAFETVENASKRLPILAPMSTMAGEMAVTIGANLLMTPNGGRGVALRDANVVIVGAGNAGASAADTAIALGASVTVLSRFGPRLATLAHRLGSSARTIAISPVALQEALRLADLIIATANVPGMTSPRLITRADLAAMTQQSGPGAVLIEVSIDGGGIAETSRATQLSQPTYVEEGVTHYCVANMPAAVSRSASQALSDAVLPYVLALGGKGLRQALKDDTGFANALQIHGGQVTHELIARELNRHYRDIDAMLFSC